MSVTDRLRRRGALSAAVLLLAAPALASCGFDYATDRVNTIAPGTNQDAVSEHCFMLILALAKNLLRQHQPIREGKWPRQANLPLRGKTLGLVGLGRIGRSMTLKGLAFGMKVMAYEPFPDRLYTDGAAVIVSAVRRNHPRAGHRGACSAATSSCTRLR